MAATWWAWDGTVGWGPRLLLPAIPLLAAFAACEAATWPPVVFRTLFAAGIAVNALGVLEPDTAVKTYLSILPPKPITSDEAQRYPAWTIERGADGAALLAPPYWVSREAALSPIRISAWLLLKRLQGGEVLDRLQTPPWDVTRPGLGPVRPLVEVVPAQKLAFLASPFSWPFLGRSLLRRDPDQGGNAAYLDALEDQVHRAQDMGRSGRAVELAERLWSMFPTPQTAVVLAESYRMAGKSQSVVSVGDAVEAAESPMDVRYFVVLGLLARDLGNDREASDLMAKAAEATSNRELKKWRDVPPRLWPRTLRELTGESRPRQH